VGFQFSSTLEGLYRTGFNRFVALAVRRGLTRDEAADVVQNAFIDLAMSQHDIPDRSAEPLLVAWVWRRITRAQRMQGRRERREKSAALPELQKYSPEDASIAEELNAMIRQVVHAVIHARNVSAARRQLFIWYFLEGKRIREITIATGRSETQIRRDIEYLRKFTRRKAHEIGLSLEDV
jgi:RNA polymerase sigma factor (sigma-70 family)